MAGQLLVVGVQLALLGVICFLLINYYKSNMVTLDVATSVYLSWVLGFVGILLLPFDLSSALAQNHYSQSLLNAWKFIYWSTFFLAWVVLPIQAEYHCSGHFTVAGRLKDALWKNFIFIAISTVAGLITIAYMVATGNGTVTQVVALLMALGNTYGVFIIIILMGSGFVTLPKRLWQIADSELELKNLYLAAVSVEGAFQEGRYELEDCEQDVKRLFDHLEKRGPGSPEYDLYRKYVIMLEMIVAKFDFCGRSNSLSFVSPSTPTIDVNALDMKMLIDLHARLLRAQGKARACERRWRVLLKRVKHYESIVHDLATDDEGRWCEMKTEGSVGNITSAGGNSATAMAKLRICHRKVCELANSFLSSRLYMYGCRLLAILCSLASAVILWSEMMMASQLQSPIGIMIGGYGDDSVARNTTLVQFISFLALAYMSFCTYWSLFRINLGWTYTLQGPQQSPPPALIFNGQYFSRLQFALGYNFLMTLNISRSKETAFNVLMSNMTVIPVFGTSFTVYVPVIMTFIAFINLFSCFSRVLKLFGVETTDETYTRKLSEEDEEKHEAGRKLVSNALRQSALASHLHNSTPSSTSSSTSSSSSSGMTMNPVMSNLRVTGSARHLMGDSSRDSRQQQSFMSLRGSDDHQRIDDDDDGNYGNNDNNDLEGSWNSKNNMKSSSLSSSLSSSQYSLSSGSKHNNMSKMSTGRKGGGGSNMSHDSASISSSSSSSSSSLRGFEMSSIRSFFSEGYKRISSDGVAAVTTPSSSSSSSSSSFFSSFSLQSSSSSSSVAVAPLSPSTSSSSSSSSSNIFNGNRPRGGGGGLGSFGLEEEDDEDQGRYANI